MLVLGLMSLVSFAEVVSLGAVLPFLAALLSPEKVLHYGELGSILEDLSSAFDVSLGLTLTVIFSGAIILSSALRLAFLHVSTRLAAAIGADLSIDVYRKVLHQPYSIHVARNSSEIIGAIVGKVNSTTNVIHQCLVLACSALLIFCLIVTLLLIDPVVALVSGGCFGLGYVFIGRYTRKQLQKNGQEIADEQIAQLKTLQEGLGGIRDVLLDGSQAVYCEAFSATDRKLRKALAENIVISGSPRYLMEMVGTVLIVVLAYKLSQKTGGLVDVLPVLGGLAVAAQRLLPALQQSFSAWATITGYQPSVKDTVEIINQAVPDDQANSKVYPITVSKQITLRTVSFRYSSQSPWTLDNISLSISRGARVGFIGETGSGKSTLLDLIMGLLVPTSGAIEVDGSEISRESMRAWQMAIAHVPQNIFLADSSVAENIAFGLPKHEIDLERVRLAAHRARISEFIESRPKGYSEVVGERGVRLSGGQRQRIGIARALYKEATVLVLDEATSALDNATEESVMQAVHSLDRDLTILMIAHRLSSLKNCDTIIELRAGRVVSQGAYSELLRGPTLGLDAADNQI
jgi:ATP-binding cassette subfamily B protein